MSCQKKKTPTELPKLKHDKVLNTRDRANINVVKSGHKRQQETDSCINSREDTVVSFRAY